MFKELTGPMREESNSNSTSTVLDRIENHLSSAPIVLFMKGSRDFPQCGFSARVVRALDACRAEFADVNILEDAELHQALKAYSQWPTFPQLYIRHEFVGGCDIVLELYRNGHLSRLVTATDDPMVAA
jgi:monothiol glutaredoxin